MTIKECKSMTATINEVAVSPLLLNLTSSDMIVI